MSSLSLMVLCSKMGAIVLERSCPVTVNEKVPTRQKRKQGAPTARLHVWMDPEVKAAAEARAAAEGSSLALWVERQLQEALQMT